MKREKGEREREGERRREREGEERGIQICVTSSTPVSLSFSLSLSLLLPTAGASPKGGAEEIGQNSETHAPSLPQAYVFAGKKAVEMETKRPPEVR